MNKIISYSIFAFVLYIYWNFGIAMSHLFGLNDDNKNNNE